MSTTPSTRGAGGSVTLTSAQLVPAAAVAMVVLQTAGRAWAAAGSWWYADDLELLEEARRSGPGLGALLAPHDSQLMPLGRLLAWLAGLPGELAWWPGALQLVVLQLAAGLASAWMLLRLFGPRPGILVPLALYLFSPLTLTAYMWWAAAVNQLPMHLAFFLAVGCHTTYVRTGRTRWRLLTVAAVTLGLSAYVKAVLILPVLLLLSVGPLARGSVRARLRSLWSRWHAWALLGALGLAYTVGYLTWVPSPVAVGRPVQWGGLFRTMVVESLGTGLVGGPWRWDDFTDPVMLVDPPSATVGLSWTLLLALLVAALAHRARSGARTAPVAATVLAVGWVCSAYLLAAVGRTPEVGSILGLELRYLADSVPALSLALALLWLPLADPERSSPIATAPTKPARTTLVVSLALVTLLAGATWSSWRYVVAWHQEYPVREFVAGAREAAAQRPRTLADTTLPEAVMPATRFPANSPSWVLGPLGRLSAVTVGNDLEVLSADGTPSAAVVDPSARTPPGPRDGCGYLVRDGEAVLPVAGDTDFAWWASLSYLAEKDTDATLLLGARRHEVELLAGLHTLFVRGEGGYGPVVLSGTPDAPVCVDAVRVGDLAPIEEK